MLSKSNWSRYLYPLCVVINIGFIIWFIIIVTSDTFVGQQHARDAITIQFSIMNIMLVCVSIFLVVAGFMGYASIKSHAEEIARKEAERIADAHMRKFTIEQEEKNKERLLRDQNISFPSSFSHTKINESTLEESQL